jgi:nucleotide-binding universal stress UspA family protein
VFDKIRILVGIDGSLNSKKALEEAVTIAKRFSGVVKVITVHDKGMEKKAKEIIEQANQYLEKEEVRYSVALTLGSNPARALQSTAKQENFDLIVVGSRGLGSTASLLLGSVSKQVVASAECNVLVVKK